jgi:hypothetical protein
LGGRETEERNARRRAEAAPVGREEEWGWGWEAGEARGEGGGGVGWKGWMSHFLRS